jgi:cyclohexanone monooxygenase
MWNWTERYPSQPELLEYAKHVADRFELRRDISFNTRVTSMRFSGVDDLWSVTCDTGAVFEARWCIMATGCLSQPKPIDISGAAEFAGESYSTTDWPQDGVDFTGKRVALIGTGSSGIQVATELAKQAGELYVMQRTASHSMPAHNRPLEADEITRTKASYGELRASARRSVDGLLLPMTGKKALEVSDEERSDAYWEIYEDGSPFRYLAVYDDILLDYDANRTAAEFIADRIRDIVDDPEVAGKLIPTGYPFGTRRLCIDSGYYEIFNQPNVTLVDIAGDPISRITADGIETDSASYLVDAIVYATGYDALTGALLAIEIVGPDGTTLREAWRDGPRTYLGLMIAGFPNLFTVTGPQSPSVLSNMFVSIEQHVEWITDCLAFLTDKGYTRIEATGAAEEQWVDRARGIAEFTLHRDCTSWYSGINVPGKPRVILPFLGGVGAYRELCDTVAADGYSGFALARQGEAA